MTTTSFMEICDNDREEFFIHIQELPWLAFQEDIRDFFHGLSIKEEGILIRNYDAFVAFDRPIDIDIAMCRENRIMLGSRVQLSIVGKAEIRQLLFRIARRKLDFTQTDGITKKTIGKSECVKRKKIRPTPVAKSKKRKIESCLVFCPKESDLPAPEYVTQLPLFPWEYENSFLPCKKKKIHPIRLSDTTEVENFLLFHPKLSCELNTMIEVS